MGPVENSVASLSTAIRTGDGIEFDLRLLQDGTVVLHHDRTPSIPKAAREDGPAWVEQWAYEDLQGHGLERFDDLLSQRGVAEAWREQAKVGVIEIKRPHPRVVGARPGFDHRQDVQHMVSLVAEVSRQLEEAEIPHQNTVLYAFHPRMQEVVQQAGWTRPWSRLTPNLPPYGGRTVQRAVAAPSFATNSFARLVNRQQRLGSAMIPCALDYLSGPTRHLPIGRTVGLHGGGLKRLNKARKGFPVYVWPAPLALEEDLLRAGLTCLSDDVDSPKVRHPSGKVRWTRPASAPLEHEAPAASSDEEAASVLREWRNDVAPWHELSPNEQRSHMAKWRQRWGWSRSVDDLMDDVLEGGATMPWEAVRLVGHRGCGVSERPVLKGP